MCYREFTELGVPAYVRLGTKGLSLWPHVARRENGQERFECQLSQMQIARLFFVAGRASLWLVLFVMRLFLFVVAASSFLAWSRNGTLAAEPDGPKPRLQFQAQSVPEALRWQREARERLIALMMGGSRPESVPLDPMVLREIAVTNGGYRLQEITLQTLSDRRVRAWVASPREVKSKVGAVLALHGHGGRGEQIVRGDGLYWYGRVLAEMGYVVAAPDIGQHDLQHTNWSLMGERSWDAIRCVDYLMTRPEVDTNRIAIAGLSLGGETTMYVAALDERIRLACSSGWLTTVDNMKRGHCPCWNFPGLESDFDFADIFAMVAPRPLVCELGERERAPGGFPVEIGREAFRRLASAYAVFGAGANAVLSIHAGGHVFVGRDFWPLLDRELGTAYRR